MAKQSAAPVSTTKYVTVKLALVTGTAKTRQQQDDGCTYEIVVQAADEKSAGAYAVVPAGLPGASASSLKYHPADKPVPEQGDCFLQLWELYNWHSGGSTTKYDQYYPFEDRDADGKPGKNRLVGVVSGVLTRDKSWRWKFVCLDQSGLPEVKDDAESQLLIRLAKAGAGSGSAAKKVAVGVENESRWELGVHLTADATEKKWESVAFDRPVCFVESLRNLIRMQIAEGGLAVACYTDLNLGGTDAPLASILKTCDAEVKKLQAAIDAAKSRAGAAIRKALLAAADARAATKAAPLPAKDADAFHKDEERAIAEQGDKLKKQVKRSQAKRPAEDYAAWRQRVVALLQQTGPAVQQAFLARVQTRYGLGAAQIADLKKAGEGVFYDNLPVPAQVADATKKSMYDVQNDAEFGREAQAVALEFGFVTVEDGVVQKGAHGVKNPQEWLQHLRDVLAAVKDRYPGICPADGPKVYRLAILTHGDTRAGLKFVDPDAPEKDVWFRTSDLVADENKQWIEDLVACLSPAAVVTLYACSTGGNQSLARRQTDLLTAKKAQLVQENDASLKQKLAEIPAAAKDRKAREKKVRSEHKDLLAKAFRKAQEDVKAAWPKPGYEERLVSYGGDPASTAPFNNTMGDGSFAQTLREKLADAGIAADVWAHTDAAHTTRNARMRLFRADGQAFDLVRLVFGDSAEFKPHQQPSEKELSWWWKRGNEDQAPLAHQQAVKKAALCSAASVDDDQLAFSLKALIANFRSWYSP